jgi:diacylglycerol kinase (ATP)
LLRAWVKSTKEEIESAAKIHNLVKRCVIVNPAAGSVKDLDAVQKQLARLKPAAIHLTRGAGAAKKCARQALRNGYEEIIAAGGDGTLNEVINGIAKRVGDVRVGVIPLGTGNDFARCLNLPATVEENIDIVLSGETAALDVVRAQSERLRYFVNVSAGGFSGLVDEKLTPEIKQTWGPLAYVRSAAAALPQLRSYRTTVQLDNKERFSFDLYNVVIANGRFVAGGLPIAPNADPADGLLDVLLIRKRPVSEMALVAAKILSGNHLDSDAITFRRAAKVAIRSRPGMWFNVDGELIGNDPIVFEVMPRALQFVLGKK